MTELLSRFPTDELIGLVAIVGAFGCGALGILLAFFCQMWQHRQAESVNALKQDMLSRGMSVEQIQAVLDAGTKKNRC